MRKNSSGVIHILLILIVVIVGGVLLLNKNLTNKFISVGTPIPTNASTSAKCIGSYTDDMFNFLIDCPNNLNIVVQRDEFNSGLNKHEKIVNLCETLEVDEFGRCIGGGVKIWANGDGWGGGCDENMHADILINNKSVNYCLYENGFSHIGVKDGNNRFLIEGTFSSTFTKEDALKILSTFRFYDPKATCIPMPECLKPDANPACSYKLEPGTVFCD